MPLLPAPVGAPVDELPAGLLEDVVVALVVGLWTSPDVGKGSTMPVSVELDSNVDGASFELAVVSFCNSFTDEGISSEGLKFDLKE